MGKIIAVIRLILVALFLFIGTVLALIASFVPYKLRNASVASWVVVGLARSILWALNVQLDVPEIKRLQSHNGLLFPTHDSFLDIVIPLAIGPTRFLAAVEVKDKLLIGRLAGSIGCIWVDRRSKESRQKARDSMRDLEGYPPIVLFPEGMLDGKPGIAPFRHGAFEIAVSSGLPYIPIVLLYEDFWRVKWKYESMFAPAWRTAQNWRNGARIVALETVHPHSDASPAELARSAERAVIRTIATLGQGAYSDVHVDDEPEKPQISWETHSNA